ncbi:hypothetical protein [Jiella marina]|uniref:hypothetical protein n=1 Tax=Jiella sp. LLJ827 TaxID=2917712 RepID=UPI00210191D5|nr:hypothetical protein [Jiella sp. LLJ827]MCQ0986428.1 hypothetical protein [Jiella sp. LLJ827]
MSDVRSMIAAAIGTGEVLSIRYHGGSRPGSLREILPIKIESDAKLRARCTTSGAVKQFLFAKIELCARPVSGEESDLWSRQAVAAPPDPACSGDICADRRAAWEALGWRVACGDEGDFFFLGLHRRRKDGKAFLKTPSIQIVSERPWTVAGRDLTTRTFRHYAKALAAFLAVADRGPA